MPTPAQIAEQVQLERDAIASGLKKLRKQTYDLESKDYASATIYGVASIDSLLPVVTERIEETTNRIREGKIGAAFKEIHQYLSDVEPMVAAAITCKVIFDRVFSVDDKANNLASVCEKIGIALENECQMRYYEDKAPGLLRYVKDNYWHRSCGTQQRLTTVKTFMNRYEIESWVSWGSKNRVRLGGWLLDCVMEASGWFTKYQHREGRKTTNKVVPTPAFMMIKDQVIANSELFSPEAWAMLIEPNNWEHDRPGGYLLNEVMRGHDFVRRGDPLPIQGELCYEFINTIQKVGYTLNPFIVNVARTLYQQHITVGKFIPIWVEEPPPKPPDIADNDESRKDYRRNKAEWYNRMNDNAQRCVRTKKTMEAVERFADVEVFYLPWSFDYRGRAYPIPSYLTPQDTDFGKSLLKFHREAFMTPEAEDWLAFQVATTYGLDKETIHNRLSWVRNNTSLIECVASDPIGNIGDWEGADEPWQFLAACDEFYHCCILCDKQYTSSCIATDATCSGLQILSGLARDKSTAELVNVVPQNTPNDAYQAIADIAKPNCPIHLQHYIDRKVTKRTVMTLPYNSKPYSNREYIREALKEKGIDVDKDDLTVIVKAVRNAMDILVPGPMSVMKWIEIEASNAVKRGDKDITWTTPSGFVVTQRLMKVKTEQVELQLLGRCQIRVAVGELDQVDLLKHKNCTAPNLIHSLDASLLHIAATRFNAPIALIHDSVLCRATDMGILSSVVRETYMHLFAEQDYLTDFAKQIGAETTPPIIGDLEPSSVIESTYFFC